MILTGLKLLSNEVTAKICCRLKFFATMASRFVEAEEELTGSLVLSNLLCASTIRRMDAKHEPEKKRSEENKSQHTATTQVIV